MQAIAKLPLHAAAVMIHPRSRPKLMGVRVVRWIRQQQDSKPAHGPPTSYRPPLSSSDMSLQLEKYVFALNKYLIVSMYRFLLMVMRLFVLLGLSHVHEGVAL